MVKLVLIALLGLASALVPGIIPRRSGYALHASMKGRVGQQQQQQAGGTRPRTPTKRDRMLEGLLDSVDFTRSQLPPQIDLSDDPLLPMVKAVALAADKRKAGVINAFRISHITEITTFMVIIEGNSRPQNQAIALAIEDDVLLGFSQQPSKEGDAASGWILLDYGSLIVHIMTPQMRNFYKLEKRWKDAEVLDLSECFTQPSSGTAAGQEKADTAPPPTAGDVDTSDPFWS